MTKETIETRRTIISEILLDMQSIERSLFIDHLSGIDVARNILINTFDKHGYNNVLSFEIRKTFFPLSLSRSLAPFLALARSFFFLLLISPNNTNAFSKNKFFFFLFSIVCLFVYLFYFRFYFSIDIHEDCMSNGGKRNTNIFVSKR